MINLFKIFCITTDGKLLSYIMDRDIIASLNIMYLCKTKERRNGTTFDPIQ